MTTVVLDGRMLRHDQAGIGRYIWRLHEALAMLPQEAVDLELLVDRRGGLPGRPSLRARPVLAPARHRLERVFLPRALRAADLVHFPDHGIPPGARRPAIVTVHDVSFLTHPETHSAASRRHYAASIGTLRQARRVIVPSRHVQSVLVERDLVSADCVTVVTSAPGLAATADGPRCREWPTPFGLMVGTIQPRKNIELAARAFAASRFSRRGSLLVAGSVGYRGSAIIRAVRASRGADRVRFLGRVADATLARLFAQAEFVLMPSRDEGFGLPALEAMALGTPVIAARAGALPEVVGDASLLIEPNDAEELTEAVDRLTDDPDLRATLSAGGRARARGFSWERTARETLAVYEACL
ncbi:MAG: glycosyltransferase family 1 protein [Chloroflexi bacterium]|nr:glycosyltransferase family 1 protein [Chloroflexota bacterium]